MTAVAEIRSSDKDKLLMKKYILISILIITVTTACAQKVTVIGQPVVCSSQSLSGNIIIPTTASSIFKDNTRYYQIGTIIIAPKTLPTRVEAFSSESKLYPFYDWENNSFIIPAFPAKSIISLYSIEGKLLRQMQTNGERIIVSASTLPPITIFRIINGDNSFSCKLMKRK